jgi:energy-coupling factor transporter ATP-binding protein EcfA2
MINKINNIFKTPIYYNSKKVELNKSISTDLELTETIDASCNSVYSYIFNTDNNISKEVAKQLSSVYTTDVEFLKVNQQLIKDYKIRDKLEKYECFSPNYYNIIEVWNDLKGECGFKEKYYYVDWDLLDFLNKSEPFLMFMSIYNLLSPILMFIVPILMLLIPFLILKLRGIPINITEYVGVLKLVATQHTIGKLFFMNFAELGAQEIIYTAISLIFYLFSVYQNITVFFRYLTNMKNIHKHFQELKIYLKTTLDSMDSYLIYNINIMSSNAHTLFNTTLQEKRAVLTEINNKLNSLTDYTFSVNKIKEIGKILKYFYELHSDKVYEEAIIYSMGFNGYLDCLEGLMQNIHEKQINFCIFIENHKEIKIKNNYYACIKDKNPIKNNIKLNKHLIITGPNASGKTTVLKSVLINIIISQQFGCGFYDEAKIAPFDYLHCYLNIPDTSGRDSLFQAEARRCKEILNIINTHDKSSHLCLFDELYSGTNPIEAETTTTEFMKYLVTNKKVSSLLTTHFVKVCKALKQNKNIKNCHMDIKIENDNIIYTYKLKNGISEIKGAINILKQFNYPKEIIDNLTTR